MIKLQNPLGVKSYIEAANTAPRTHRDQWHPVMPNMRKPYGRLRRRIVERNRGGSRGVTPALHNGLRGATPL